MAYGKSQADSIDSVKHIAKQLAAYRVNTMAELPVHLRKQLRKEAEDIALNTVFGENHKKDANGVPIEHGIGSPGNQTRHSVDSFKKYNDMTTPENLAALARMEKELATCEAKRRAERAAQEKAEDDELAAE
jgi:hypothetical protein